MWRPITPSSPTDGGIPLIRALRRRGPAALGLALAAVLTAATGCGGDEDAVAAGDGGKITLNRERVRQLRTRTSTRSTGQPPDNHRLERGTGSDLSKITTPP